MSPLETLDALDVWDLVTELQVSSAELGVFDPRTIRIARRLAVEFWRIGQIDQAIHVLDHALSGLASAPNEHPVRGEVLATLAEILIEEQKWDPASAVLREMLAFCIARSGHGHASSIAARGDLASVLYELGKSVEAERLQLEAIDLAKANLNAQHPVRSVLAWNRFRRCEEMSHADEARRILIDELLWLLSAEIAMLDSDQRSIRDMVAGQINWNAAKFC